MARTKITSRKKSINPIPGESKDSRLAKAYERLGITEEECKAAPQISHILKSVEGGIPQIIEYIRGSEADEARRWVKVYDDLPISVANLLPFEAFCVAANITTKKMLEVITGACFEQATVTSNLIAKAAHPKIIKASVESAGLLGKEGWSDRQMLHQREGFAPIPKTQVINIGGDVNQDNSIGKGSVSVGALASIHNDMGRITDRFNASMDQKLLEVGDADNADDSKNGGVGGATVPGYVCTDIWHDRVIDVMDEAVDADSAGDDLEDTEEEFWG